MDEMMQEQLWKVLVRTNIDGNVVDINSSAFLQDTDGWVEIDSGYGDRYHHAQGNYLLFPLVDERGVYRYKLSGGEVIERSEEEMNADYTQQEDQKSDAERIAELEAQNEMLLECVMEMSEIVYA